ncbi:sensor histidine kinase [Pontibacter oryzae]|uniref:Signal transduction histidine kinase internal region domain-containing protein n=1 Tax=Pontibacter oryzae TaxID=2304593 RepID=A0A399RRG2_9BACT|nr:histidine kinase [Pontibacter oryzae]RIJ34316.1 hypothetical protein D1627_15455 [Pontibacter oryzae]
MLQKQNNYIRELLVVALITSVFFGVFSVLPMLLSTSQSFLSPPMPPGGRPRMMRPPSEGLSLNILVTTLLMLTLWLMNILLYARISVMKAREQAKNILRYIVSYALMFALISLYFLVLGRFSLNPQYGRALFFPFIAGVTNNTIVIIILELVVLQRKKTQVELENAQLKMNSMQAQHQHLKHQLQPHFLFNALNTLKTLIRRKPQEAEDYLVRLAEFLRASLTSDGKDTVPLGEELKLCTDYLEMQKVRFKDAFTYDINIPESIQQTAFVPVFALQLLAENAIKHNGFTVEEPLGIHIRQHPEGFIEVCNNKKAKRINEQSSGIGLKNLRERYSALSEAAVRVTETEKHFCVQLPILTK